MLKTDPRTISDTRVQLHWASQLLGAAADALLEKAGDDSHSNLGWEPATRCLQGRADCSIDVANFELEYQGDVFALTGQTLADSANWMGLKLDTEIRFRDYEMPEHEVRNGSVFSPNADHLVAICDWLTFGQKALAGRGELRVWPHHFDMGFWVTGESEGKSIGGGVSLGDPYFDQPYFYINPYGIDRPEDLPPLAQGHWTEHWFGAVLTAESLMSVENADDVAADFVKQAMQVCTEMVA